MLYHNVRVMGAHLMAFDAMAIASLSFVVLHFSTQIGFSLPPLDVISSLQFSLAIMLGFLLVGTRMQAYHARRTERISDELITLVEVSVCAIALAALVGIILIPGLTGGLILTTLVVDMIAIVSLRLVMRSLIRHWRRYGKDYRVWLIVGASPRAESLSVSIAANPHFGVRLLEIVDLPHKPINGKTEQSQAERRTRVDARVLSDMEEFRDILESNVVDEVVITLPLRSFYDEIQQIISICSQAGISIKLPPDAFECSHSESEVALAGNLPMVTHFTGPSNHTLLAIKRIIDVLGAMVGFVLFSPLMLVAAITIKLNSKGPILYFSDRIGLHGREFKMVKFRTMVVDADKLRASLKDQNETNGLAFKIKNDPRITRIGKILRQYHLDELPQLWNVLTGDMSIVGPRPLPEGEAPGDEWWQRRRLSMPPGLTCFWQVQGDHEMSFEQWAKLDLNYIDSWSLWLDIKLIALTVLVIFRRQGW